jgi:cytochrome c-type biogenesis protein CcmH
MKYFLTLIFFFSFYAMQALAAEDFYQFKVPQEATRFDELTGSLRCLVCQNQTLAESNAPLAEDLRHEIYEKIIAGQSNGQIIDYLTSRYGDFILYNPPFTLATFVLWFGPLTLLLSGLWFLMSYLAKNRLRPVRN